MLIRTIAALGALAAIGIALVIAIPAIANTSPCSGSVATPNSSSAGLVADCNALSLGNLFNLWEGYLYGNDLTGSIPSSLGDLSKLQTLSLHDNDLSGSVPASLGNLSKLTDLHLDDNDLSGSVPSSLGGLSKLTGLYLAGNQLTGCVPAALRTALKDNPGLSFCAAASS